jgi:hypothetical protein
MRSPELSFTVVPITLEARIAEVCPEAVVMVPSPSKDGLVEMRRM